MKLTDQIEFIKNKPARNRMGIPPMDTLMAENGFANDFHIMHYGSKAYGGFGTIIVESTAISPEGKIRDKDLGLWKDEQIEGLSRVSKIIKQGGALAGIQINHAGAKSELLNIKKYGATKLYDYLDQSMLKMIDKEDEERIKKQFVESAIRAKKAGFDFIEIHAAHGYLLSEIISIRLNDINDEKNLLKRSKLIVEIIKETYEATKMPLGIRLSINDDNYSLKEIEEMKEFIKVIEPYVVYFNISSGVTTNKEVPINEIINKTGSKLFRVRLAKKVREFTSKPLFIAGNISNRQDVEEVFNNGIDIALLGRESISNPSIVINEILNSDEIDKDLYHWNNNIWWQPKPYKELKERIYKK